MRLKENEIQAIKTSIHELDPEAQIYLFGSRAQDGERGGDIDLLVFSQQLGYAEKIKIRQLLYEKLGEQKIDLIVAHDAASPFIQHALEQGVRIA